MLSGLRKSKSILLECKTETEFLEISFLKETAKAAYENILLIHRLSGTGPHIAYVRKRESGTMVARVSGNEEKGQPIFVMPSPYHFLIRP